MIDVYQLKTFWRNISFKNIKRKDSNLKTHKLNIVPAILEKDFESVSKYLDLYTKFSNKIQIDICDGDYVKSLTWLPNNNDDISSIDYDLEFDIMCTDIQKYLDNIFLYDTKYIVLHIDNQSEDYIQNILKRIRSHNPLIKIGICSSDIDKIKSNLKLLFLK